MTSNVDVMCQDCGNHNGISSEELEGHTMCQACRDIALFKQPPPNEDCPICFLPLPSMCTGSKYKSCCGKMLCSGCVHAVRMMDSDTKCPFCRVPAPESDEEVIERIKKRMEMDDGNAIHSFGCYYHFGELGFPQDYGKALELWHRAGDLGSASSYHNIGSCYKHGSRSVERDIEKAVQHWELAAIGGHAIARYNLGYFEEDEGNMSRALKHHMIAAECGDNDSLEAIREFYVDGHATKDDYAKALRAHQKYMDGIKSAQRDAAALFDNDRYCYR